MRISSATSALLALLVASCGAGGAPARVGAPSAARPTSPRVAGIPPSYHAITPSLVVADMAAAIAFYEDAFGATTGERVEGRNGALVHAEVRIADSVVMLSPEDVARRERAPINAGATTGGLFIYVPDVDRAVARAANAGATVRMQPTDMFWGDRYAQVRDPSGHHIAIATHRFDLTRSELRARGAAFMDAMQRHAPPPAFSGGQAAASFQPRGYLAVTPMLVVSGVDVVPFYLHAFGATERERMELPDGRLLHGEMQIGDSMVMLGGEAPQEEDDVRTPAHLELTTMTLYHYVPDVDASFARALRAGAQEVTPVTEMFWGDRVGVVVDPSGQAWSIATHVRDVSRQEMARAAAQMGG
jgi:PhnB protein